MRDQSTPTDTTTDDESDPTRAESSVTRPSERATAPASEFTPGPWTLGFTGGHIAVVNAGAVLVCKFDQGRFVGERLAEHRANARLIAASPSLLDVLKRIVKELRTYHQSFDARLFMEAERCIAKAEGRDV